MISIDEAIARQQRKIRSVAESLAREEASQNYHKVIGLRRDLAAARVVAVQLDEIRRQQTPADAQTDTVHRGSIFVGGNG